MATPEHPRPRMIRSLDLTELQLKFDEISRQLELIDAIENQIERCCKSEELMEIKDALQVEIDRWTGPSEVSTMFTE